MSRLSAELKRLFFLPTDVALPVPDKAFDLDSVHAAAVTRVLLIAIKRGKNWPVIAKLFHAIQHELKLPVPAVSLFDGVGYGLWFSLEKPEAFARAKMFLQRVVRYYLSDIDPQNLICYPPLLDEGQSMSLEQLTFPPRQLAGTEHWSAFIDPSMGDMFADDPWLEMEPNPDRQADLLGHIASIKHEEFSEACSALERLTSSPSDHLSNSLIESVNQKKLPNALCGVGGGFSDPRDFLLAVMNDVSTEPALRVEAAKSLLLADKAAS